MLTEKSHLACSWKSVYYCLTLSFLFHFFINTVGFYVKLLSCQCHIKSFDFQNTGVSIFNISLQNLINVLFHGNSPNWVVKLYLIIATRLTSSNFFINFLKNS